MSRDAAKKINPGRFLALPMSLWGVLFVGLSLLYIIGLSLMTAGEEPFQAGLPATLQNYRQLNDGLYLASVVSSLRLAFTTSMICLILGYPFAYFLSKASPKARTFLMVLLIVPFWTNALIRIYGWKILLNGSGPVNSLLKAFGLIQKPLKLLYTEGSVLLGMVYAMFPFMVLPVYSSVERLDWSMVEASRDLGASPFKAFLTVTVPMTLPGMLAGVVLTFIPSIGLFFLSDILGGANTPLLGNLVQDALTKSHNLPFAAALSVVLLSLTGLVILIHRRLGGSADSMVF